MYTMTIQQKYQQDGLNLLRSFINETNTVHPEIPSVPPAYNKWIIPSSYIDPPSLTSSNQG
jgi:hypothetical protein